VAVLTRNFDVLKTAPTSSCALYDRCASQFTKVKLLNQGKCAQYLYFYPDVFWRAFSAVLHQEVKTYLPGLSTPSEVYGGPRSIGR
jgi:hypothetical protein